ncbi:hypothetical protein AB7M23_004149 [Pseudomonas sp. HLS-6 TE3448]
MKLLRLILDVLKIAYRIAVLIQQLLSGGFIA